MKKLEMTDTFDCTPDEFWAVFFNPTFTATLDAEIGFKGREELLFVDDAEKIHTKSRVIPKGEVPPHIQQMLTNGLKMLQQVVNAGPAANDLPEPMQKMLSWGKSAFKDFLNRDPKSKEPPKPPQLNMSYIEEGIFSKEDRVLRWTITPELFKDISSFKGEIRCEPEGAGCRRTIDGEFTLGIPGAGEMIESFLLEEIAKGHKKAAVLTQRWLNDRKADQQS